MLYVLRKLERHARTAFTFRVASLIIHEKSPYKCVLSEQVTDVNGLSSSGSFFLLCSHLMLLFARVCLRTLMS
jgi:hypothetical protein